jgi:hypothetical protein
MRLVVTLIDRIIEYAVSSLSTLLYNTLYLLKELKLDLLGNYPLKYI